MLEANNLLEELNLTSLNHTFEHFNVTEENKSAYQAFKTIAEGKAKHKGLLVYGITGSGKTHLVEALILEWVKQGIYYRFQTIPQLMRFLRECLAPNHIPKLNDVLQNYFNASRLIFDDYGMGITESSFEQSLLEEIIDEKYRRRFNNQQMITILTTNKDIKGLPDRIVSRFFDPEFGKVILIESGDYRRGKWQVGKR